MKTTIFFVFGAVLYSWLGNLGGGLVWEQLGWLNPPLWVGMIAGFFVFIIVLLLVVLVSLAVADLVKRSRVDEVVYIAPDRGRKQAELTVRLVRPHGSRSMFDRHLPTVFLSKAMTALLTANQARASVSLDLLPDPLRTALPRQLRLQRRLAEHLSSHLILRVGPEAASGAWEALLTRDRVVQAKREPNELFTVVRELPARAPHGVSALPNVSTVVCAPAFALIVEDGWKESDSPVRLLHRDQISTLHEQRSDVLHVIGSPVPGELGAKLKVEGATFRPEQFAEQTAQLIVLQAEPTRSSVSSDPRSALLRAAAYDVAVASRGAAVLTIPAVPGHVATDLISEIARVVNDGVLGRETLIKLVQRLRGIVYTATPADDAVVRRCLPAFDVCLYIGV